MFISSPQSTFRNTASWTVMAGIIFLGMLAWAGFDSTETRTADPWLWGLSLLCGVLFSFTWLWAAKRSLKLHPEGIAYESLFSHNELRFDEISETRYSQKKVSGQFGLIGLLASVINKGKGQLQRSFKCTSSSSSVDLNSNFRDLEDAIRLILAAINPRLIQEAESTVQGGGIAKFGKLALNSQGIIWKDNPPIPFSGVAKCRIDNQSLRIKTEGKWLDNVAVSTWQIPNLFVFLDMVERRCAESGKKGLVGAAFGSSIDRYL